MLEHGLLDAAQGVDDLILRVARQKGPRTKKNGEDDDEEEEEDVSDPDQPTETPAQYQMRVNLYVQIHLSRASGSKRDHYKDGLVYQTRKDLINEFLKTTITKKCQNADCNS